MKFPFLGGGGGLGSIHRLEFYEIYGFGTLGVKREECRDLSGLGFRVSLFASCWTYGGP